MLLHTVEVLEISVVLIMGHDRLYSMLTSKYKQSGQKIIKLPRSGGVVSRDTAFRRQARSVAIRRYFYGDTTSGGAVPTSSAPATASTNQAGNNPNAGPASSGSSTHRVPQLTPFLAHVSLRDVTVYKLSSVALSASLLPVAATQSTESVQLTALPSITEQSLQHSLLAVCHPTAVQRYQETGEARALYESGVAGFVLVERVLTDTDMLHLLSPCAGQLPSHTFLIGDITWMD